MEKTIKVVGAIIENEEGQILCTLRPTEKILGNYWEFPGGKVEEGETAYEAIKREIKEELEAEIEPYEIVGNVFHKYERGVINLIGIRCKLISKHFKLLEHDSHIWLNRKNLNSLVWAPADIELINKLKKED